MKKGSFLIEKICYRSEHTSEFQGIICTPSPIKEIFEVRHQLKNSRTIIGKNAIAYFGEILVKVFYINREHHTLCFAEKLFRYRGFSFPECGLLTDKTHAHLASKVLDIFVQLSEDKEINISGIVHSHLTLTLKKEIDGLETLSKTSPSEEDEKAEITEPHEEFPFTVSLNKEKNSKGFEEYSQDDEVFAEVGLGDNQDLTIFID